MLRYKKFILAIFCFLSAASLAQTVKVKKETARIKGQNTEGIAVELAGTEEEVNTALLKYLKTFGKVRQSDGVFVLTDALVNGNTYGFPVYGLTRAKETMAQAWIGITVSEWPAAEVDKINNELEKISSEFGMKFYRDKIQVQIDESLRALTAVERQQQRLVNEDKSLNTRLEDNKRQKMQLEKSLEANKTEYESLLKKLDKNKHDQDSVTVAAEQVKKVVEMHRERQRKVN